MSSAAKEQRGDERGDERAQQSARQTAERAARKKQGTAQPKAAPRAKRGGATVKLDGDGADDVSSSSSTETETEQEAEQRPAQEQEVPLASLVTAAQRISRKDTQESFEMVSPAADRGVVALEDSAELPGPGEGWERVESRDAEDRPTYSDVAAVKKT